MNNRTIDRLIFICALCALCFVMFSAGLSAQSRYAKDSQGNYTLATKVKTPTVPTYESLTKNAELSAAKYRDQKGNTFAVFLSKNGKVFFVRQSKAGNWYRTYID